MARESKISAGALVALILVSSLSGCGDSEKGKLAAKQAARDAQASASASASAAQQQEIEDAEDALIEAKSTCAEKFADFQEVMENARTAIENAGATNSSLSFMVEDADSEASDLDSTLVVDDWCSSQVESNLRAAHEDLRAAKKKFDACYEAKTCEYFPLPTQTDKEISDFPLKLDAAQAAFDNYGG